MIQKATPTATLAVSNSPQTYNGSSQAANVAISVSSVSGAVANIKYDGSATVPTNVGTYVVTADFVPTDSANYNSLLAQSAGNFVIQKATPTATLAVSNSPQTYNGSSQAANVAISVSSVSGAVANIKYDGSATVPTNVGTYVVTADFVPTDSANYNSLLAQSAGNFVIQKATPTATLAVSNSPQTYNGSSQAANVAISVSSVSGAVANIKYDGSATVPTNVGTYVVTADFVPTDSANYNSLLAQSAGNFVIQKAPSMTMVTCPANVTYIGAALSPCAATVTGAGGLSLTPTPVYANNTIVGTASASSTYVGDANHTGSSDIKTFAITKATPIVSVTGGTFTFDGTPKAATGFAYGVGGVGDVLIPAVSFNYVGTGSTTYGPTSSAPTTVGSYQVTANFAGNANYNSASNTAGITITTGFAFNGFHSPIGGSVENGNGGSFADPIRAFKLDSTIPVKFGATWLNGGAALITGIHTLQAFKYSNATDSDPPIDAKPTDAATTGNQFRLTSPDWHFNLSTKGGFSAGTWLLIATLQDGSKHSVWITIKK